MRGRWGGSLVLNIVRRDRQLSSHELNVCEDMKTKGDVGAGAASLEEDLDTSESLESRAATDFGDGPRTRRCVPSLSIAPMNSREGHTMSSLSKAE